MCRLGYRSGLSSSNFREVLADIVVHYDAISDHGDSGGAVWAFDPSDAGEPHVFAVAVTSFMLLADATNAGAVAISPLLEKMGLNLWV